MEMTPQRWQFTKEYLNEVFGRTETDPQMSTLMQRAREAGLPDIAVSADVGQMLQMLAMMVCQTSEAKGIVIELGTLAGYSGIWLARGMQPTQRLITVELDPKHAAFARDEFARAGMADRVKVVEGPALEVLQRLSKELGQLSVDLIFLDAVKQEYPDYLRLARPMLRQGGLLVADNALGSGSWWIDSKGDPDRDAVDVFNRMVAGDPGWAAACVPAREGVLIARKL